MSSSLDRDVWIRISTVFDRAIDVRGDDRTALLDQLCGSDATIRREVEGMLEAHDAYGLLAERRLHTGQGDATTERDDGLLLSGARVGPYRIDSPIGAGGMGDVYRAE